MFRKIINQLVDKNKYKIIILIIAYNLMVILYENIIYNELIIHEFNVDVGVVEYNFKDEFGKSKRIQYEIDLVANSGSIRVYIQSAQNISSTEKENRKVNH